MNLQLNLMVASEIRSGSKISKKFLVRLTLAIIPIILLGVLLPVMFSLNQARQNLESVQSERTLLNPIYEAVLDLKEQLTECEGISQEMDGWQLSRVDWLKMLTELQLLIPINAQLTRCSVTESIEAEDGVPARKILLMLKGKIAGGDGRQETQSLDRKMKESSLFTELMSKIEVRLLGAADKEEEICIFDATCVFKPRLIGGNAAGRGQKRQ